MADTDISLSVGLDVRDAEKTAKDLQKEVRKIFDSRDGEQSAALTNLELQMKKTYESADALRAKLQDLSTDTPTQEYTQLNNSIAKLEEQFDALALKLDNVRSGNFDDMLVQLKEVEHFLAMMDSVGGTSPTSLMYDAYGKIGPEQGLWTRQQLEAYRKELSAQIGDYQKLISEQDRVSASLDALIQKRQELEDTNSHLIIGKETDAYREAQTELDLVNDKLKQQIIRHDEMTDREIANYERIQDAADRAGSAEEARQMKTATAEMRHGFASATRSVMGLNLAVRGVGRLIPGVSTRATSAIASASRGVIRLASLTKNDLKNAIQSLSSVVMKLLTSLMSHPVVLAIVAALGVLIVQLIRLKKMLDMTKKALQSLAKEALEFLKTLPKRLANLAKLVVGIGTAVERYFIKGVAVLICHH